MTKISRAALVQLYDFTGKGVNQALERFAERSRVL
jgi:hypothetical protein